MFLGLSSPLAPVEPCRGWLPPGMEVTLLSGASATGRRCMILRQDGQLGLSPLPCAGIFNTSTAVA